MMRDMRSYRTIRNAFLAAAALSTLPSLIAQQENQDSSRTKAIALEQQNQNAQAQQIWEAIAKTDPQNAEAFAHLGLLEARQQHYDSAIDFYRRAAAINPDLPNLQMNLGLALFKIEQFPDAVKSLSSELEKHPGDPRLTILTGMAHYGMKDYLVAIPYLKRATERDPQSVSLRLTLAHSCLSSKQYQCVIEAHKEILALQAESPEADLLAAEAFDQLGDSAKAAAAIQAALSINPNVPNAHFALGYILWTQRKWTPAADAFQQELHIDPNHAQAQTWLADSQQRLHQTASNALPSPRPTSLQEMLESIESPTP